MKQKKHHIVVVTSEFPPQPGGIGNHAYNLALHLHKTNHSVEVIADQRSEDGAEEEVFDQSLAFFVKRIKRYNWRFIMYLKRILVTFKSFKNASAVIATGKFSLWNVAFCSLFFKTKTIAVVHGSEVNFKSFVLKKTIDMALKRMDCIVAVSNYTKSLIQLNRDIIVIPNGINLSEWSQDVSDVMHLKGKPVLTTVGRVSSRKGQLNVIKLLPEIVKQFPEIHYHCVGIPTEAEYFSNIAEDLGVSKYVTFHGSVNHDALKNILKNTDVFIMLSTETKTGDVEGFGIAILEANALGVPAIGSKKCGIEDAIDNYKSGVLINDNPEEFNKALETILNTIENYQKASILWAQKHSWSNIVNRYLKVIQD
ncbi:glycosyltransferase family 4 protein [Psychroserpens mesophilus]|uniref:glycosyltransferase family 4 protein n=1 Tax=Psychroserpens mesophilus TaxID=325473 RepID=UPI003D6496F5